MNYLNLDVRIEPSLDGYQIRASNTVVGEASEKMLNLPVATDIQAFIQSLNSLKPQQVRDFGASLFSALFLGKTRDCYQSCRTVAEQQKNGLRIRLNVTNSPELTFIPWEYLYDVNRNQFLAQAVETPIVRYLDLLKTIEPLTIHPPIRILIIISSPSDIQELDVEREWKGLTKAMQGLVDQGKVIIDRQDEATLEALRQKLRQNKYHILHFIGHGSFDEQEKTGLLIFEDVNGASHLVKDESLGLILNNHDAMRLVVLNACEGATAASDNVFAGVAQTLVQQGIPAVIAMQTVITDTAAQTFSCELYGAIADGYAVDSALSEARVAISAGGNAVEWGVPVLYMRTPDGRIFIQESEINEVEAKKSESLQKDVKWHSIGTTWLVGGLLGLVLIVGCVYLLLEGNSTLQNAVLAMGAMVTFLLSFFGITGDRTLFPRLSQFIGRSRIAQGGSGVLLALGLTMWGIWGPIVLTACDPVVGCKTDGELWFVIGEWKSSGENLTGYDQLFAQTVGDALEEKLNNAGLKGFRKEDTVTNSALRKSIDFWLQGDFQKTFNKRKLTARISNTGGKHIDTVSVEGIVDELTREQDVCLLHMQNQLVLKILDTIKVQITTELIQSMQNIPTNNCEALRLQNEASALAFGGELQKAKLLLDQVLTLDPKYADAHNSLGWVLLRLGQTDDAIAHYQRAIELLPETALYHFNLGEAMEVKGDYAASIGAYQRAIDLDPLNVGSYNNLGYTYLLANQADQAAEVLKMGLALDTKLPQLHKNLGRAFFAQGSLDQAADELKRAIELVPNRNYPEAYYYLAAVYSQQKNKEAACIALHDYKPLNDVVGRSQAAAKLFDELQCQ